MDDMEQGKTKFGDEDFFIITCMNIQRILCWTHLKRTALFREFKCIHTVHLLSILSLFSPDFTKKDCTLNSFLQQKHLMKPCTPHTFYTQVFFTAQDDRTVELPLSTSALLRLIAACVFQEEGLTDKPQ